MTITDTTFFTNEEWQSLVDRFKVSLPNNSKFFDVLVWYFRSSWFFQLYESLENVEKIRILVWLNIDKPVFDMIQVSKKSKDWLREDYVNSIKVEFNNCEDDEKVETWVEKFIQFINEWKLEIKIYPEPIHSKIYIMRKNLDKDPENYGKVITWSSNFSYSWLKSNLEFNVELKDKRDVDFALERFEQLWEKWVDVTYKYIETIKNETWLNDDITPYDLYLKFLYEYFWDRVNDDKDDFESKYLPNWFMELKYQTDAVKDIVNRLNKYNWVFLADVVWLWKTYISALVWQKLGWKKLIICPPHLKEYWESTFQDFQVSCKVESLWKLQNIIDQWHEKYKYIFIDEAHRFRNDMTQSYEKLKQICIGKKIILVSATPFNNKFKDLYALITLFQEPRNSSIPNLKNLDIFFKKLDQDLNQYDKKEEYESYLEQLEICSEKVRERVLKPLMIRRTRKEIETYFKDDIVKQWLKFPLVENPNKIMYQFDTDLDNLFNWTIENLSKMSYARYTPARYIKEEAKDKVKQIEIVWQANLKWFMKTLIIKRLESSFFAFKNSLNRFIESYEKFINMYEEWVVYISRKVDVYELMESDLDKLMDIIDKWDWYKYQKGDLRNDQEMNFEADLYKDLNLMKEIYEKWKEIDYDPKYTELERIVKQDIKTDKVIIFSESKETIEYLNNKLSETQPWKVIFYSASSKSTDKNVIKQNFDPNSHIKEDKYNILLTTDILAEWINLHKSNIIINYDIPWNPTRVLQRIWRINRVWTKRDKIYIYNFFPTVQSNNEIKLEENVKSKMDAFIKLLWTDAKYLTDSENIEWHSLFDKLNSAEFLNNPDWLDIDKSELKYLNIIRQIRDKDEKLFQKIRKLPKKSRSWRKLEQYNEALITFFRKWDYLKTFITDSSQSRELNFEDTVEILECEKTETKHKINKNSYYHLLEKNKQEFKLSLSEQEKIEDIAKRWRSNESEVIKYIEFILSSASLIDSEEQLFEELLEAIRKGHIPAGTLKKIKNYLKENVASNNATKIYNYLKNNIPEEFYTKSYNKEQIEYKIEVILNEYII